MEDIIFSSWQGEVVDNRIAAEGERKEPANVKLPPELAPGERIKAFMGWDGIILCDDDVDIVDMCASYVEAVQKESCGKCFPCRVGTRIVGDWRLAFIGTYSGGRPVGLGTSVSVPLFAGRGVPWVSTYDGWRAPTKGDKFDPAVDTFLQPASFFGPQPANTIGNQTRLNPRLRELPAFNERFSISKMIVVRESMHFELRGEFFNAFNRVRMGVGNSNVTRTTFGKVTGAYNSPRQVQVGARFVF